MSGKKKSKRKSSLRESASGEPDENILNQKMLSEVSKMMGFHVFNPDEHKLRVINEIMIVDPKERITSSQMTNSEYCEVISNRAKHIENSKNVLVFTDVGDEIDPREMAKKEIRDRRCPLSIIRMYNNRIGELWTVNELPIPF